MAAKNIFYSPTVNIWPIEKTFREKNPMTSLNFKSAIPGTFEKNLGKILTSILQKRHKFNNSQHNLELI